MEQFDERYKTEMSFETLPNNNFKQMSAGNTGALMKLKVLWTDALN